MMQRWKIATFAEAARPGFGSQRLSIYVSPEKTTTPARLAVLADGGVFPYNTAPVPPTIGWRMRPFLTRTIA
jgi:hypothetical protein